MNTIIAACVKYLNIQHPYRITLQSKLKNPDWFAYHNCVIDTKGKILRHDIRITMEDINLYDLNTIVAHEFVHAWQTENKIKGRTHGKQFQKMALRLQVSLLAKGFNIKDIYRPDIDKP